MEDHIEASRWGGDKMKGIFVKFVFLLTAGIIALTPKPLNAQTTDEYEWRYLSAVIDTNGAMESYELIRWAFKKNGEPINDTTYTLNVAGTTYVCGVYADTVISEPDSDFAWVVTYKYVEEPYDSLQTKYPTATFRGDSVTTGTKWVYVTNIEYTYPGFSYWGTMQDVYYQQYEDGSVHDNAWGWVGYSSSPSKEKCYMIDNTVYYLSIPLNIQERINKPQTVDLKIYPNPANVYFNIELNDKVKGKLTVYDLESRVIDKKIITGKTSVRIDASGLSSGGYIIVVETQDGTKVSKRIVLVK